MHTRTNAFVIDLRRRKHARTQTLTHTSDIMSEINSHRNSIAPDHTYANIAGFSVFFVVGLCVSDFSFLLRSRCSFTKRSIVNELWKASESYDCGAIFAQFGI